MEKDYHILPPRASPVAGLYEVVNEIWDFGTGEINMRFGTMKRYCNGLRILRTLGWSGYICIWDSPRGAERGMQWQNNDPQRCPCPNLKNLWIYYFTWQRGHCSYDWDYEPWHEEIVLDCPSEPSLITWFVKIEEPFQAEVRGWGRWRCD